MTHTQTKLPLVSEEAPPITSFRNEFFFLSNFYVVPVVFEGAQYPSSEHAFQAAKYPHDRRRIFQVPSKLSAAEAKHLGRKAPLDWPAWCSQQLAIMRQIVTDKFERNSILADRLINTFPRDLIEANTWNDKYWGVDRVTWKGHNHLGKILMAVRDELMNRPDDCPF